MYNKIINPLDNQEYSIFSQEGKALLKNYLNEFYGGSSRSYAKSSSSSGRRRSRSPGRRSYSSKSSSPKVKGFFTRFWESIFGSDDYSIKELVPIQVQKAIWQECKPEGTREIAKWKSAHSSWYRDNDVHYKYEAFVDLRRKYKNTKNVSKRRKIKNKILKIKEIAEDKLADDTHYEKTKNMLIRKYGDVFGECHYDE